MRLLKVLRLLAVGIYLMVTRVALLAAFIFSCLFFVLNSSPFPDALSQGLRQVLPGFLQFGTVQMSPIPWRVDILDVRIDRPNGESVVKASSVRVNIELLPLIDLLVGRSSNLLHLHFSKVRLNDFEARIFFDDQMHFEFLDAFVKKDRPQRDENAPKKLQVQLTFDDIEADGGACYLRFPQWDLNVRSIRTATRLYLVDNKVKVESDFVDIGPGQARITVAPDLALLPRSVDIAEIKVKDFLLDGNRIEVGHFNLFADGIDVELNDGALNWGNELEYAGEAAMFLPEGSPITQTVTLDRGYGELQLHVVGEGNKHDPRFSLDLASPTFSIDGQVFSNASIFGTGGLTPAGYYEISAIDAQVSVVQGRLRIMDGRFLPKGNDTDDRLIFSAKLDATDVPTVLAASFLNLSIPPPPAPVPTTLGFDATAELALDFGEDQVDGALAVVGRFSGPLPSKTVLDGREATLRLDAKWDFKGAPGNSRIRINELDLRSGLDWLRLRGDVDFVTEQLRLSGFVKKELESVLGAFGVKAAGRVELAEMGISGLISDPTLKAKVLGERVKVGQVSVNSATTFVNYANGQLLASQVEANLPFADFSSDSVRLDIFSPGTWDLKQKLLLTAKNAVVSRFNPGAIWSDVPIKGFGQVKADTFAIDLNKLEMAGEVNVAFAELDAFGRGFEALKAVVKLDKDLISVPRATVDVKGGGALELSGELFTASKKLDVRLVTTAVSLPVIAGTDEGLGLEGLVDLNVAASGRLNNPTINGTATVNGVRFKGIKSERLAFEFDREPSEDMHIRATSFLPKMSFNPSSVLSWENGRFSNLYILIDINRLTPQDLLPSVKVRDVWGTMTGHIELSVPLATPERLTLQMVSPPQGLRVGFFNREVMFTNQGRLVLDILTNGTIVLSGVSLWDGQKTFELCGIVANPDGKMKLLAKGAIGAYGLRAFKDLVSSAEGYVYLDGAGLYLEGLPQGCSSSILEGRGPIEITGSLDSFPLVNGVLRFGTINVGLRRMADIVSFQSGGRIILTAGKRQRAKIDPDNWIRGTFGDGAFSIFGEVSLKGLLPNKGEIGLTGSGIRLTSPGEFYVVANPNLNVKFAGMADSGMSDVLISGQLAVIDGAYHKNFDVMKKAFSGFTGRRVAARTGRSLVAAVPWLDTARLDVGVTGSKFGVRSKVIVGSTDLELGMDLRLKGTIGNPELWNRVEIVPGGKVTYDVVRRQFEVTRGTLDFSGPIMEPIVDVTARTRVEYSGASTDTLVAASRFTPDDFGGMGGDDAVLITLNVSGRYPDVDIELSSNSKSLTQTDLQYLLLTGSTQSDSGLQMEGSFNVGLLTEDVTNLLTNVLLGSFVDAINFGVTPTGGVNVDVMAHMGSRLKFDTKVLQGQGTSRFSAGFHVRLTDRLSLQGKVRGVEQSMDPDEIGQTYETKLRYRIPID